MDIQTIKGKLARVGLPTHGTDDDVFKRAVVNGIIREKPRHVDEVSEVSKDTVKIIMQPEPITPVSDEKKVKLGRPKKA